MTTEIYSGRCFCGAVQFNVHGPVLYSCFCHCESCQRASGGAYVGWATFARDGLDVRQGELTLHHSSPGVTRGHCATCGSSITYEHVDRQGQVDIALTLLDDRAAIEPVAHIWVEDRFPFVRIDDGLPRYSKTAGSTET